MDSYALSYLLKGIGDIPVGQAETAMLVLAIKHGYVLPEALLEVHRNNHYQLGSKQKYNLCFTYSVVTLNMAKSLEISRSHI